MAGTLVYARSYPLVLLWRVSAIPIEAKYMLGGVTFQLSSALNYSRMNNAFIILY